MKTAKHDGDCTCIECVPRDLVEPFDEILVKEFEYGRTIGIAFETGGRRMVLKLDATDAAKLGKKLARYVK